MQVNTSHGLILKRMSTSFTQRRKGAKFRKECGFAFSNFSGASCGLCGIIIFLLLHSSASAQNYAVQLYSVDNNKLLLDELVKQQQSVFATSGAALGFIQNLVPTLQQKGYLAASVDSVEVQGNTYTAYVFAGHSYKWAQISLDSIPEGILTLAAVKKIEWTGRTLNPGQVSKVSEQLLEWAENNGYPFARVWLDIREIDESGDVSGNFMMDKGTLQKIDTVRISGDVKISRSFLLRYLELKQGDVYNEKKLRNVSNRLKELPFLAPATPWTFEFTTSQNSLDLYLREKKANQLNAIIGLLPNNQETGKFLLTVDALFAFHNILSQGESINVSYQNLQYKSPRLKADVIYPYLFNTPFGVDAHFDLFKKDTSFRRTTFQAGVRYQLTATNYFRAFYQNQSNRLIAIDTSFVKANKRLPDNVDVSANGGGMELGMNKTDYRISPRHGWEMRLTASALLRHIRKSDAITGLSDASGFDYASLYDTLIKRQYQYFLNGNISYYIPVGKIVVFKSAYDGGWVGGGSLFRNELYQIGGFRLLRGFDEQSIFTNQYHVVSLELRLLLDQNSYFYLFSDNGYAESNFNGFFRSDFYNGFGIGTTLETRSGLFTISYALGRNNENPIQFRQSKIHFGYVAFF
jgi:outer membrane protein assembly factor BamA